MNKDARWVPTVRLLKNLNKVMDKKIADKGMTVSFRGNLEEEKAVRKRLSKLSKIRKMEHEFTGEEDW